MNQFESCTNFSSRKFQIRIQLFTLNGKHKHSNMCQKLILWFKIHFYSHNESKHAMITVMCLFSKFVEGAFARDCMFKIVKTKNEW